jgi:molybdopterin/thiamine biosynthesis adenylyltransferase
MVVFLSKEELDAFQVFEEDSVIGYAYEWENEDVVHLHTRPLTHAFGRVTKCVFSKHPIANIPNADANWYVHVSAQESVKVYRCSGGDCQNVDFQLIPSKAELYSRNKGILEVGILEHKHVVVIGLGSFGSQITIELAKAGVGEFSLVDFDRVELHNLARHTCYIKDLGRLKTDAIEEAVLGKNPYAVVHKYPMDISKNWKLLNGLVANADLMICCTDNNPSRFLLSQALFDHQKCCIFGRAFTRAEGGDVFIYRPGQACYSCLVGNMGVEEEEITDEASARQNGIIPAYVSAEDAEAMVQVGLSADIEPICNMMVKLALVELSKGEASGITSLEEELVYNYYLWANRRDRKFANWHVMPGAGPMPTIMRWYGAHISRRVDCVVCSEDEIRLDTGDDLQ